MHAIYNFFSNFTLTKGLILALTPLFTMIITMKLAIIGLSLIIALDLITGVNKSLADVDLKFNPCKKAFWQVFSSYGLRQSWKKSYEYGIGIIVFAVLETYFLELPKINLNSTDYRVTEVVILGAAAIEVYSIYENLRDAKSNSRFIVFLGAVLKYLGKFIPGNFKQKL